MLHESDAEEVRFTVDPDHSRICYICMEPLEEDSLDAREPECNCQGSIADVHDSCLIKWRTQFPYNDPKRHVCMHCKRPYATVLEEDEEDGIHIHHSRHVVPTYIHTVCFTFTTCMFLLCITSIVDNTLSLHMHGCGGVFIQRCRLLIMILCNFVYASILSVITPGLIFNCMFLFAMSMLFLLTLNDSNLTFAAILLASIDAQLYKREPE